MMKHSITLPVTLMAILAMTTPALGMRPLGRELLADEAPAPEQEAFIIDSVSPENFSPPEDIALGRGYSGNDGWRDNRRRGGSWRDNNNDYDYNYRRDNDDDDIRTIIIVGTPVSSQPASKTLAIDPWRLGQQYPEQTASVGDVITFKWSGNHGVYRIPSGSCPSDFTATSSNGISVIQAAEADGTAEYTFGSTGTYWFACPVGNGDHCNGGMIIKIVVS
ncbi:hypothetical protein Ndes2526B_g01570 [Nannochloris sp. 'desiccata']|nr:hypothetical protein NADE_002349 [Chlorella desiccata (nom. nud.)]